MSHPALARLDHRPWPIPERRWSMRQSWHDLLFAHWRVPAAELRPMIPAGLEVDTFDGSAWLGVVPFRMSGIALRPFPPIPGTSAFPELNVRTYVTFDGKPGVWFFSLDAANGLAVWAAKRFFHLPYWHAKMSCEEHDGGIDFHSTRKRADPAVDFTAKYRPTGDPFHAEPGTLESFLVERYCLYAARKDGALYRGEIHHLPWPLQSAEAELGPTQLLASHGRGVGKEPPLLHFARRVDVMIWPIERVA